MFRRHTNAHIHEFMALHRVTSQRRHLQSSSLSGSHSSPIPSPSASSCLGLGSRGQLSQASPKRSPTSSPCALSESVWDGLGTYGQLSCVNCKQRLLYQSASKCVCIRDHLMLCASCLAICGDVYLSENASTNVKICIFVSLCYCEE